MPKYKIDLVQTIYEGATVYVDADTQEEAEDKVYQMLEGDNPPQIEWKFADCQNNAEITSVEEWPPRRDEPPDTINTPSGVINLMDALRRTE
jgi:hypothetical protein